MAGALAERLPAWAVMGGVLSAAGLPIYLSAPAFYAQTYGLSLTTLGFVLFGLRLFDVVQDPALGWFAERLRGGKRAAVAVAGAVLALSMVGLFAVAPPIAPIWWFAITITGLFSAYSFLTIVFYGQGVARAGTLAGGHVRLAAWRESGALLGICLAAVMPAALAPVTGAPLAVFAFVFALGVLVALVLMAREWAPVPQPAATPIAAILADGPARGLLILALINAAPLAVSSSLFLFFVQHRLTAPGWEGPLLILFFLTAAITSPGWSALSRRFSAWRVLAAAMVLAILTFGWAVTLGAGDIWPFAVICILSGATIGADLTLLPALFSARMGRIAPNGGQGFGLWSFMNKATLAIAAITTLPLIEAAGFDPTMANQPDAALSRLTLLYAGVPCGLKCLAIALVLFLKPTGDDP